MTTATAAANSNMDGSLNDFFKPLSLGDDTATTKPKKARSRSVKFADEKQEAQILLETILLFETDDDFCDESVVEAVMEDFHDGDEYQQQYEHEDPDSSFDSLEYAYHNTSNTSLESKSPASLAELEQQVREQQAKELEQKAREAEQKKAAPNTNKPQRSANKNLRRALEKSSSLRMLEEAAGNRRAREEDIKLRRKNSLKNLLLEEEEDDEDEKEEETTPPPQEPKKQPPLQRAKTHEPFTHKQSPLPRKETKEEETAKADAGGPGLRRTQTSEEKPAVKRRGRMTPRRNVTFDGTTAAPEGMTAARPTRAMPKRTKSNNTGPRNVPLRRVRTHDPTTMLTKKDITTTNDNDEEATTKTDNGSDNATVTKVAASTPAVKRDFGARRKTAPAPASTAPVATSSTAETVKSVQQKRVDELKEVQDLSMVGANTWNQKQRLAAKLQRATRGFLVRQSIQTVQSKIHQLQLHLKAMERSKQQEINEIQNTPELVALKEEYQRATMDATTFALEQERQKVQTNIQSVKDNTADIEHKMHDLEINNQRIAKMTREINYRITLLKERNATLQATQDQLQSKVDQLQTKVASEERDIEKNLRQTETEKQVGRICQKTIGKVREHTKVAAATSDDPFLKKVHRRSQIIDRIQNDPNKKRRNSGGGGGSKAVAEAEEEVCPVIMSR